jgi:hypothetical protein
MVYSTTILYGTQHGSTMKHGVFFEILLLEGTLLCCGYFEFRYRLSPKPTQGKTLKVITEFYFKSCRVDLHWQSSDPDRRRGIYPATNDQFVRLTALASTGSVASRKETPGVGRGRAWLGCCCSKTVAQCS